MCNTNITACHYIFPLSYPSSTSILEPPVDNGPFNATIDSPKHRQAICQFSVQIQSIVLALNPLAQYVQIRRSVGNRGMLPRVLLLFTSIDVL